MPAPKKGPVSQRDLVPLLVAMIDAAMAKNSTAHRDIARDKLRWLLENTNWRTSWVLNNIAPKRCRYLSSIGYWTPTRWSFPEKAWPGTDKAEAEA